MEYGSMSIQRLQSGRWLNWGIRFFLTAALTANQTAGGYAPFALGCIAAAGPGADGAAALLGGVTGALLFLDFQQVLALAAVGILILTAATAFRDTAFLQKPWVLPVLAAGMVLAVGGIYVLQSLDPLSHAAPCAAASALTGVSAHFFTRLFQPEEDRLAPEGLLFLGAALTLALGDLTILNVSVGRVLLCALLAWLSAKKQGGTITLRIEDLDKPRCPAGSDMLLEDDLHWLGLEWDTGGSAGGKDAPYYQSRRFDIYAAYFAQLQKLGLTYPCFCNRAELHAAQAPHLSDGRILYAGTCRHLTAEQTAAKARTKDPAQRLRLPDTAVSFIDGHYGPYTQNLAAECGDIILRRSDGVYAYQLAVVVDDALMGITEIVRGCDLLSSTPQQLYLYQLLGFTPPAFIHVPLLMAADGRRLSKRDRDLDLGFLRQHFVSPQPLIGLLAFLAGLLPAPEPVSAKELLPLFNWQKVPHNNIIVSEKLLNLFKL